MKNMAISSSKEEEKKVPATVAYSLYNSALTQLHAFGT